MFLSFSELNIRPCKSDSPFFVVMNINLIMRSLCMDSVTILITNIDTVKNLSVLLSSVQKYLLTGRLNVGFYINHLSKQRNLNYNYLANTKRYNCHTYTLETE